VDSAGRQVASNLAIARSQALETAAAGAAAAESFDRTSKRQELGMKELGTKHEVRFAQIAEKGRSRLQTEMVSVVKETAAIVATADEQNSKDVCADATKSSKSLNEIEQSVVSALSGAGEGIRQLDCRTNDVICTQFVRDASSIPAIAAISLVPTEKLPRTSPYRDVCEAKGGHVAGQRWTLEESIEAASVPIGAGTDFPGIKPEADRSALVDARSIAAHLGSRTISELRTMAKARASPGEGLSEDVGDGVGSIKRKEDGASAHVVLSLGKGHLPNDVLGLLASESKAEVLSSLPNLEAPAKQEASATPGDVVRHSAHLTMQKNLRESETAPRPPDSASGSILRFAQSQSQASTGMAAKGVDVDASSTTPTSSSPDLDSRPVSASNVDWSAVDLHGIA